MPIPHPIRLLSTVALSWALVLAPLAAHEAWAERVVLIHYGHAGADATDPYEPDRVRAIAAIDAEGAALEVAARAIGGAAVAVTAQQGDPAAVFFILDTPHYIVTGSGDDRSWDEASAEEAAAAPQSWVGSYHATSIFTWHRSLSQPRGGAIQLVPLADPLSLADGAPLPLRAYRDGEPLAGLELHGSGDEPLVSDAEGHLRVPLQSGLNVLVGKFDVVTDGRTRGYRAVLSFTRP